MKTVRLLQMHQLLLITLAYTIYRSTDGYLTLKLSAVPVISAQFNEVYCAIPDCVNLEEVETSQIVSKSACRFMLCVPVSASHILDMQH